MICNRNNNNYLKNILVSISVLLLLLTLIFFAIEYYVYINFGKEYDYSKAKTYEIKLIEELENRNTVLVKDIFDFPFERGFVIEESYFTGESFAQKYGLDISVNELLGTQDENTRQIIFVDEQGELVYEFRFKFGKPLSMDIDGFVFYPITEIQKVDSFSQQENSIGIKFVVEQKDYLMPVFCVEEYQEIISNYPSDIVVDDVTSETVAAEQAKKVFDEYFDYATDDYGPFYVYYDKAEDVWLVKASLPRKYAEGVPKMLVKSNGDVLSIWKNPDLD